MFQDEKGFDPYLDLRYSQTNYNRKNIKRIINNFILLLFMDLQFSLLKIKSVWDHP